MSAVVRGSRILIITAEKRVGLNSAFRACVAICRSSRAQPRFTVATIFWMVGTIPLGCLDKSTADEVTIGTRLVAGLATVGVDTGTAGPATAPSEGSPSIASATLGADGASGAADAAGASDDDVAADASATGVAVEVSIAGAELEAVTASLAAPEGPVLTSGGNPPDPADSIFISVVVVKEGMIKNVGCSERGDPGFDQRADSAHLPGVTSR